MKQDTRTKIVTSRLHEAARLLADACGSEFTGNPVAYAGHSGDAGNRWFAPGGAATFQMATDAYAALMAECYGVPRDAVVCATTPHPTRPGRFYHCLLSVAEGHEGADSLPYLVAVGVPKAHQARVREDR